jgi:biotin operon repressor
MSKGQDLETRFWAKVRKTRTCWIWVGARGSPDPYGFIAKDGVNRLAHRVSWELHRGLVPDGMQVCHKCDVPYCVNPAHLFLGTQADNMRDKMEKGRAARGDAHGTHTQPESVRRGSEHGMSKLDENQVQRMREEYAKGGISQPELARKYEITQAAVNSIMLGKTWQHAGGPIVTAGRYKALSDDQVREVRRLFTEGWSGPRIARHLGVGRTTVYSVRDGRSYTDVK